MSSTQQRDGEVERAAVNTVLPVKVTVKVAELLQFLTEHQNHPQPLQLLSVDVRRGHSMGVTECNFAPHILSLFGNVMWQKRC